MAEAFFAACGSNVVATLAVDYVVKPIERRIRYLFRFRNIVEELHKRQQELATKQEEVNVKVNEAKLQIQTQVPLNSVNKWLTDAENAQKDVESLDTRIQENKKCCCNWGPNWCWRYRLSKDMEKKTSDLVDLVKNSQFELVGHRAELPALEFMQSKGVVASKSSTKAFNEIVKALEDDKINKIGVWGMGGVGKTTLVEKVGGEVKDFGQPIMAVVSRVPDIGEIQNKIADAIHLKFEKKTKDERAKKLWSRLKDGKFLIILDDLWNEWNDDDGDLRKIGIPLIENGKGCKIILTTRRKGVCESMKCQVTVEVNVLDGDEAWALFKSKAELDERILSEDIIRVAKEVADECKGLPVAIVTLASALKGAKTLERWELALEKLESNRLIEIGHIEEEGEKNAYMCIKTSYEYLRKETDKKCFLLCALFPEDHSIDVEDLARYAWGLGLYSKSRSVKSLRTEVLEAIDFLIDSCLLLEDDDEYGDDGRYVKLHDIVRDVALWIASKKESGLMIKSRLDQLQNETFECCNAISLLNSEEEKFPVELEYPKLEIMLLENCDVQGTCFRGMTELKVLTLMVDDDSPWIVSLYALRSLRKLRALHLENLEEVRYLGDLATLEILSLRGSGFEGFADELGKLVNLRILDLYKCQFSSNFAIGRMSKLVEINLLSRLTVLSLELSSLDFREDFKLPEKLERYDISISAVDEYSYSFSITEKCWKIKGVIPLSVFSVLPKNLESLKVWNNLK